MGAEQNRVSIPKIVITMRYNGAWFWKPFFSEWYGILFIYLVFLFNSRIFLTQVLTWLGYSNSAFNPIIYSIFNTEFRDAFRRILTTHYPDWCFCKGYRSVVLSSDASIRHRRRKPTAGGCDFVSSASATALVAASAIKQNGASAITAASTTAAAAAATGPPTGAAASPRSSVASLRQSRLNSSEKVIVETEEEATVIWPLPGAPVVVVAVVVVPRFSAEYLVWAPTWQF